MSFLSKRICLWSRLVAIGNCNAAYSFQFGITGLINFESSRISVSNSRHYLKGTVLFAGLKEHTQGKLELIFKVNRSLFNSWGTESI